MTGKIQAAEEQKKEVGGRSADSKGQKRRSQIVDVARQALIDDGPNHLVLRDVAEKVGITHGNLQYYFPTKNDLLMAIFDQELEKYTASMKEAVSATSTRRGRLDAIVDTGIAMLKTPDTTLWRTIIALADHSPELAGILKKENDLYEEVLTEELALISPALPLLRRRHIARIIHALLDGLAVQYIYEDADSPEMRALAGEMKVALFAILEAS
jgi:AcrR family transcriptional regulator